MKNEGEILIINIKYEGNINSLKIISDYTVKQIISIYIITFLNSNYDDISKFKLKLGEKTINHEETLLSYLNDIKNNCVFDLIFSKIMPECMIMDANENEIDIKFFKKNKNIFSVNYFPNLFGLLKLCLLKEIAISNDYENIKILLPEKISRIMNILKRGKIKSDEVEKGIQELLNMVKGGNILNFAKYVDGLISQNEINTHLISNLNNSRNDILYIYNCLGKYIEYEKLFELEFKRAKNQSIFEYIIISSAIIEREDIYKFEQNRQFCPNRVDRVLFHGTSFEAISKILPDMFYRAKSNQNGEGVYFTQELDSCWIYGSEEGNNNIGLKYGRRNLKIPKVGQCFSFIASGIYYNKNGFRRVIDNSYNPKKNEINFALAEMTGLQTVKDDKLIDKRRFYGTEFVINDLDQICPFLGLKLKRVEYCIIWRDTNFSKNSIYNNPFDNTFKNHLAKLWNKINQKSKINIYACSTSEEALKLVNRKKYNKIILISNIGNDYGGKIFADNARKIIGNNVIILFNAYNINHLTWVKNYKNALFSNDPKYYEEYFDCFHENNLNESKNALMNFKIKLENHYNVKFNFDNYFLFYPYAESLNIAEFKDLIF